MHVHTNVRWAAYVRRVEVRRSYRGTTYDVCAGHSWGTVTKGARCRKGSDVVDPCPLVCVATVPFGGI